MIPINKDFLEFFVKLNDEVAPEDRREVDIVGEDNQVIIRAPDGRRWTVQPDGNLQLAMFIVASREGNLLPDPAVTAETAA